MRQTPLYKTTALLLIVSHFSFLSNAYAVGGYVDPISPTEISCGQYGMAIRQAWTHMWDLRKNAWAMLTMPRRARKFEAQQAEHYRQVYLNQFKNGEDIILPVTFESKIAFLDAMMNWKSDANSDLGMLFKELEPKKKKLAAELITEIVADIDGGRQILGVARPKLNYYQVQNRVLRLQALIYESFYPKLFAALKNQSAEETLEIIARGRFLSFKLTKVLKDFTGEMGFYKEAGPIGAIFDKLARENTMGVYANIYMNTSGFLTRTTDISSMLIGSTIPAFPLLPKTKLSHWVVIPNEMWNEAMEVGFEKVWETKMKGFLVKKYGKLIQIDSVRNHAARAYTAIAYTWLYVGISYGIYKGIDTIIQARKILRDNPIPGGIDENGNQLPPEKIEKKDLNEAWEKWLSDNPGLKPGDTDYDAAHSILVEVEN